MRARSATTRILVPIDGSRHALRALSYVARRARRGEKIDLKVLYAQSYGPPIEYATPAMLRSWQRQDRRRVLENAKVQTIVRLLDGDVIVKTGEPATEIVAYVKTHNCNEVVMGTRGMGRLKGLLLGSIATRVTQVVPVPVTLVK